MKKIVSTLLAFVLVIGMLLSLASCNMISGTYKHPVLNKTYEFKLNKVTITPVIGDPYTVEYKIEKDEDGDKTITFIYQEGETEDDDLTGTLPFSTGEVDGKEYIQMGILKYYKQ